MSSEYAEGSGDGAVCFLFSVFENVGEEVFVWCVDFCHVVIVADFVLCGGLWCCLGGFVVAKEPFFIFIVNGGFFSLRVDT